MLLKYSAAFCFVDGSLTIKRSGWDDKDGSGHFAFTDDDLQYEQSDCSSKVTRWINVSRDDLIELRDFLNKELPGLMLEALKESRDFIAGEREVAVESYSTGGELDTSSLTFAEGQHLSEIDAVLIRIDAAIASASLP